MTWLNRYVPSLLALACMACAAGRTAAPARPQWPLPQDLVRWEPVPGVSIVAPRGPSDGLEPFRSGPDDFCGYERAGHHLLLTFGESPPLTGNGVCTWRRDDLGRYFKMDWEVKVYAPEASPEDKREQLRMTLLQHHGIPENELSQLPAPWYGWEWRKVVREWWGPREEMPDGIGELLRDRWLVAGTSLVFLQVISREGDPFAEGEAFLDSLRVTEVK